MTIEHELNIPGVSNARLWGRGARGVVYRADFHGRDVAVKIKFRESLSTTALTREARALALVNRWHLGPKLRYADDHCVITDFIDGADVREWLPDATSTTIASVFTELLEQAFLLDFIGRNKGELHRLTNNLLITDDYRAPRGGREPATGESKANVNCYHPVLLDFERLLPTERPQNVTQIVHYLVVRQPLFHELGLTFCPDAAIAAAGQYKHSLSRRHFCELRNLLFGTEVVIPPDQARASHGPRVARFRRRVPSRMKSHASNLETLRRIARAQHEQQ